MSRMGKYCHCVIIPVSIQICEVTALEEKQQSNGGEKWKKPEDCYYAVSNRVSQCSAGGPI